MKKFLFTMLSALLPFTGFAQLKVDANGHVGVGVTGTSFLSPFSVGNTGETGVVSSFSGIGTIQKLTSTEGYGYFADKPVLLIDSESGTVPGNIYGTWSVANNTTSYQNTLSVGVFGQGFNAANPGIGVGVSGHVILSSKGAGIYGDSYGYAPTYSIDGRYAGFFYGNVKVANGVINGTVTSSSDERLKEDLHEIADTEAGEDGSVIGKLELLTPVSFRYREIPVEPFERGSEDKNADQPKEEPSQVMTKRHFGFVAQELQQVYPDLVYEQDNGYLAVNYTELIPLLVQSIKELKAEVDALSGKGEARLAPSSGTAAVDAVEAGEVPSMDQNVPNPFTEKTDIAIYLPESVKTATLYIYDLSGKQLEQHAVEGRGDTVMTIHAERMDAGMYVYSLIADKKVVTTRKMIVVK
ncbi:MAG: tail fiber domain-containing protein [Prevotella sp.]|nr:tail fiber domain-containing protein [Prevotella sp.]